MNTEQSPLGLAMEPYDFWVPVIRDRSRLKPGLILMGVWYKTTVLLPNSA